MTSDESIAITEHDNLYTPNETYYTRDRSLIEAHKAKKGRVQLKDTRVGVSDWVECRVSHLSDRNTEISLLHRLMPIRPSEDSEWHCEPMAIGYPTTYCSEDNPIHHPPCGWKTEVDPKETAMPYVPSLQQNQTSSTDEAGSSLVWRKYKCNDSGAPYDVTIIDTDERQEATLALVPTEVWTGPRRLPYVLYRNSVGNLSFSDFSWLDKKYTLIKSPTEFEHPNEPIETRDPVLIEAHKAKDGKVEWQWAITGPWQPCNESHIPGGRMSHHRLLPIESPGGGASTREGEDGAVEGGVGLTPPPGPTWEERPDDASVEAWAQRCANHISAGYAVWRIDDAGPISPVPHVNRETYATRMKAGDRFALVHPAPPERITPPDGVTVIGWTEPTADEPRSLPIVWGRDIPAEGWERLMPNLTWCEVGHPALPTACVIRPIPEPPAPETERVQAWAAVRRGLLCVTPDGKGMDTGRGDVLIVSEGESGGFLMFDDAGHVEANRPRIDPDGFVEVLIERGRRDR